MKDEEIDKMADDFVNAQEFTKVYGIARKAECGAFWKYGFLAGLKAGRPQWHKVADELPTSDKDKYYFVVDKMNVYMIARFYESKWSNYAVIEGVIAWCEIPTFDKEIE